MRHLTINGVEVTVLTTEEAEEHRVPVESAKGDQDPGIDVVAPYDLGWDPDRRHSHDQASLLQGGGDHPGKGNGEEDCSGDDDDVKETHP